MAGLPVAAVGSAYATAFNNGMQAPLANLANQGVIVNYLDLNLLGDRVAANLAAFGLVSAGACPIACVTTNPEPAQPISLLRRSGPSDLGRLRDRRPLCGAPARGAAPSPGAGRCRAAGRERVRRHHARPARPVRRAHRRAPGGGLSFYVSGNAASADRPTALQSLGYELDTFGATAGAEYDMGGGAILGAALNYSRGEADMDTGTGRAKARGWQGGVYGGWSGGGAFVEGYAGYGWLDYDIARTAVIDEIAAETDGTALTAGGQAGYLFDLGGMRIGPVVGLRYAKVELDGFTETGDPVLTLNVEDQETDSLVGSAGDRAARRHSTSAASPSGPMPRRRSSGVRRRRPHRPLRAHRRADHRQPVGAAGARRRSLRPGRGRRRISISAAPVSLQLNGDHDDRRTISATMSAAPSRSASGCS